MHHDMRPSVSWTVQARIEGHIDYPLEDYVTGLTIVSEPEGTTRISGQLNDLPALYGLILQLRDAGLVPVTLKVQRQNRG